MRLGTLFSGIGAPEQGAMRVYGDDLELAFACEWDKFARQSFKANYDIADKHFHTDINDMDGTQYKGKVDVIVGGSPCQDFSIAGLRAGVEGKRGQLIWQYFRIIQEVMPPIFIYENVKGFVSDNNGKTLKDFLEVFRTLGYNCHSQVVNTKDYGVPQNRERIYIVGFLDINHYHRFQFAPSVKLIKRLKDVLEQEVDKKYTYIGENKRVKKYLENNIFEDNTWIDVYSKLHRTDFASCITTRTIASCLNYVFVNGVIRKPTTIECLRLQDFPDTFKQVVSDSQMYKQAGNSMSVNILEMIFNQIENTKKSKNTLL